MNYILESASPQPSQLREVVPQMPQEERIYSTYGLAKRQAGQV